MAHGDSIPGSVVYVVSREDGWHKIGVTADVPLRLYHLSRDLGFKPVELQHTCFADRAAAAVENLAHWALIDHENRYEWFNVSRERAIEAVEDAKARADGGERMVARFSVQRRLVVNDQLNDRIAAILQHGETRHRFMERAVEAALERRENEW